ncbi:MAG: FecR domain-containing protein [Bacteroidetes bacterium]|nr:FecR domain-containing protein [Bacteroidota bacterium]
MKEFVNDMNDDLLIKYLVGETTDEENVRVNQWIAASEANKKYFEQYLLIWEKSKELSGKSTVNEAEAWERFSKYRDEKNQSAKLVEMTPKKSIPWRSIAAILVVILAAGLVYLFKYNQSTELVVIRSSENVLTDTLPDGSVVILNKRSAISYPKQFSGNTRMVNMEGEGFFTVTPDKTNPFIIHAGDVDIKVVGTSFNVRNTPGKTEVIVETGIVKVSKEQQSVELNPNEMATVFKNQLTPVKQKNVDELYNYYRTKEFVCNATALWKLVDILNEAYGANIIISDSRLKDLQLNTTFRNESLDEILKVISVTFNIRVEKKNGQILLQ